MFTFQQQNHKAYEETGKYSPKEQNSQKLSIRMYTYEIYQAMISEQ